MITIIKTEVVDNNNLKTVELRGNSNDDKPTEGIGNGSTFLEVDTGKLYLYDLDSTTWNEA